MEGAHSRRIRLEDALRRLAHYSFKMPTKRHLTMKARFYYAGIRVRDLKQSINFYTKILGMKVVNRGKMSHGGEYIQMVTPGTRLRLELN